MAQVHKATWRSRLFALLGICCLVILVHTVADAIQNHCTADCNANGSVAIEELVRAVNISLGISQLTVCQRADRDGGGTVSIDELIAAVNRSLSGCALVNVDVDVYNSTSSTITLFGARVSGPPTGTGEQTTYTVTIPSASCANGPPSPCDCPGASGGICRTLVDLAPGVWRHEICVDSGNNNCTDLAQQKQYRRAVFSEDTSAPAVVQWTAFKSVKNVTNLADSGAGSLRQALVDAGTAPAPTLVQFRRDIFPAGTNKTITSTGSTNLVLKGPYMEVDGTDPNGDPSPVDPWPARIFRRHVLLSNTTGMTHGGAFSFGMGPSPGPQAAVDHARIVGLAIERQLPSTPNTDQDLIGFTGGTNTKFNRVSTCQLDGGGGLRTDVNGYQGADCVDFSDVSTVEGEANVIENSELRHCGDRGVKAELGWIRVEDSWVHNNLRCGLFALLANGRISSNNNVVESNGKNGNGQVIFESGVQLISQNPPNPGPGTPTPTPGAMELKSQGDILRTGPLSGISIRDNTTATVKNDYICGMGDGTGDGRNGISITVDSGNKSINVRGTTMAYNQHSGVRIEGGVNNANFGNDSQPDAGNNAIVQNVVGPTPAGHKNFENNTGITMNAIRNQWQSCGNSNSSCGSVSGDIMNPSKVNVSPAQPHRADPDASPMWPFQVTSASSKAIGAGGQLVRLFGVGFNAIEGHPAGGDCSISPAAQNTCNPIQGTCVELYFGSGPTSSGIEIQAVTPTMAAFKWPNSPGACSKPVPAQVCKNVASGTNPANKKCRLIPMQEQPCTNGVPIMQ